MCMCRQVPAAKVLRICSRLDSVSRLPGRCHGQPASSPEFSRVQQMVVKREALGDKILMNWLWKILLP